MVPSQGYIPDFLTPPPSSPLARFEDELELFRRTPASQVRQDLETFARDHRRLPEPVRAVMAHPRRELARLARTLDEFWRRALEPHWPRLLALLAADLRYRATRLTEGGPEALFADLDPRVALEGAELQVGTVWQGKVDLRGQGLLLVPAAFHWRRPAVISAAPWQPTLIYAARGVGMLWEPAPEVTPELGGLIGESRARLLAALDAPRTTTELAQLLGLTPGGVSQHLSALSAAAVVQRRRQGRIVLYARTALGDSLISGSAQAA